MHEFKKLNYEALFFLGFMIVMAIAYLFVGLRGDGSINIFSVVIRSEYIFNAFLVFSITFIARKLLLAEHQWRSSFEQAVNDTNKKFLEEVKASVPLSNMRYIDSESDWYMKAISMLQDPTGFSDPERSTPRVIFASTTILKISEHEILSGPRLDYFRAIAEKCCSTNGDAPQYRLLLSPGNDIDTKRELNARLDVFDSVALKAINDAKFCKEWGGKQIQIRVAEISGIDFVIYGNSVLFNLRTYKDDQFPERKGIYVNDANIATTFRRWFTSIYDDATNSETISTDQATKWDLCDSHSKKLGVSIENKEESLEKTSEIE